MNDPQLMGPKELLLRAWSAGSRPSRQWLARHTPSIIPGHKIGQRWFYSLPEVMAALGLTEKTGRKG